MILPLGGVEYSMNRSKRIIIDLDNTISVTENSDYENSKVVKSVADTLTHYHNLGWEIVIHSSRNMRTYDGNIGKINANTLPIIVEWLTSHKIPFDEIIVGKPWCGTDGFYVDDRAIRPSEFSSLSLDEINELLDKEKIYIRGCT